MKEGVEKRRYFLQCVECGSQDVRFSRKIIKEKGNTWDNIGIDECYMHDGFGWELDRFTITCAKCGSDKIQVEYEELEEAKEAGE